MVHVSGPSLEQLDDRGDRFAADIRRAIVNVIEITAPTIKSIDDLAIIRTHWTKAVDASLSQHLLDAWLDSADDTYTKLVKASQRVNQARPQQLIATLRRLQPNHPMAMTAAFLVPKVVSRLAELFLESAINRLVAIGDLVWNTARTQMLEGMQAGESIAEIRERLVETVNIAAPRAEVIARTEVIGASNAGSYAEMKATGLNATKEWIATEDHRTRPSHEKIDGQEVDIDGKFIVGGYAMSYPHDPSGPPQETISCRCTLGWDIPEEEFLTIDGEPLAASGAEAFHLPGKHNQDTHGHKGPSINKNLKSGGKLKITHGLVHKKHDDGSIVAVTKNGDKVVVWEASKYHLAEKDDKGDWITQKTAIKSKAYKEINDFAPDWHEPIVDGDAAEPPMVSTPPTATTPKPANNVPHKTLKATDAGKYGLKAGKRIDIDQEMIDKNYPTDTIIAVTPDAKKKMTWYGGFYGINSKNQYGVWEHGEKLSKSNALAEMNKVSADWHEPISGKPELITKNVTPIPKSKPKPTTVPLSEGMTSDKPITITQDMFDDFPSNTALAVSEDGAYRVAKLGDQVVVQKKSFGLWNTMGVFSKGTEAEKISKMPIKWFSPKKEDAGSPTSAPTKPTPKSAPAPTATAPSTGPKTFTPIQKAYAQSIFGSNGVKWHTDTKKIYDSALEVSQKDPSLTMADALAIMDQSLQKKTGDPFQTKMTKFLQTKAGMKYAQEKGGSAPVGSTTSTVPAAPKPSVNLPKSNAPAKEISPIAATAMQKRMDEISPPPWTSAQQSALKNYTGGAYTEINKCARGTGACSPATLNKIKQIKAAMKPSTQNIKIYRKTNLSTFGVKDNAGLESLVGGTIRDDGVISTSVKEGTWSGQVHMKIEAPVGSKMAWVKHLSYYPNENEIILAPGTEFEVVSVTPHYSNPNERVMVVRIVPGSGTP